MIPTDVIVALLMIFLVLVFSELSQWQGELHNDDLVPKRKRSKRI